MGIFDQLDGALGLTDYLTAGAPQPSDIYSYGQPFAAYMNAYGKFGMFESLGGTVTKGKGKDLVPGTNMTYKQMFKKDKSAVVKLGDGTFALVPTQQQMQEAAKQYQTQQFETMKASAEELFGPNGPAFLQDVEKLASGSSSVYGELDNIAADFTNKTIAASSFATDPGVQKFLTAPIAQQLTLTKEGIKQQAQAQKLGVLGVPGFGSGFGFAPQNTNAPGVSPYSALAAQGMGMGFESLQAFNTAGIGAGFLSSLIGAAAKGFGGA